MCCTHLQALVHRLPQFSMSGKIDVLLVKHAVLTEKLQLDLVRRFITEELKITVNSHIPVRRRDLRIESKVFYSERTATYGICFVFSLLLNILYCTRWKWNIFPVENIWSSLSLTDPSDTQSQHIDHPHGHTELALSAVAILLNFLRVVTANLFSKKKQKT